MPGVSPPANGSTASVFGQDRRDEWQSAPRIWMRRLNCLSAADRRVRIERNSEQRLTVVNCKRGGLFILTLGVSIGRPAEELNGSRNQATRPIGMCSSGGKACGCVSVRRSEFGILDME